MQIAFPLRWGDSRTHEHAVFRPDRARSPLELGGSCTLGRSQKVRMDNFPFWDSLKVEGKVRSPARCVACAVRLGESAAPPRSVVFPGSAVLLGLVGLSCLENRYPEAQKVFLPAQLEPSFEVVRCGDTPQHSTARLRRTASRSHSCVPASSRTRTYSPPPRRGWPLLTVR